MKGQVILLILPLFLSCKTPIRRGHTGENPYGESKISEEKFLEDCSKNAENKQIFTELTGSTDCHQSYEVAAHTLEKKIEKEQEEGPQAHSSPDTFHKPPVPEEFQHPMGTKKPLLVYDSCTGYWVNTGLPYREHPTFPETDFDPSSMKTVAKRAYHLPNGNVLDIGYVPIHHLEKFIPFTNTKIPKVLRGIWWMDGNPVPEVVVTTHSGSYTHETKTFSMYYSDDGAYSWLPNSGGSWGMWTHYTLGHTMSIVFGDSDPDHMKPGDGVSAVLATKLFSYEALVKAPTTFIENGLWKRETGKSWAERDQYHCYNMRRIVDEHGRKLPVYDYFVAMTHKRIKEEEGWHDDVLITPKKRPSTSSQD